MRAAALVAYAALALWWIYDGAERQLGFGNDAAWIVFAVSVVVAHLVVGAAVGSSWVVLLPVIAVLVAVPAGYPDANRGEPFPIWLGLAVFAAPLGVVASAVGIGIRRTLRST